MIRVLSGVKKIQILQRGRYETIEQLSPLSQLQMPTVFQVINFGTNSNLNLP
jgi:hypothetical protein